MILLVALTCASLWLIIAAPPRAVARLRSATVRQGGYRTGAKSSRQAAGKIVARARGPRTAPAAQTEVDIAILLDLIAVALKMGSPIPDALSAVGRAIGGHRGEALCRVAAHLALGSEWELAWREIPKKLELQAVAGALAPAWLNGAPVTALLHHAQRRIRQQQAANDRVAAKQLGVRLILPVTFCYLPAFVAIGLVPVVLVLVQQGVSFL